MAILRQLSDALRLWKFTPLQVNDGHLAYLGRMQFTLCNINSGSDGPSMTILKMSDGWRNQVIALKTPSQGSMSEMGMLRQQPTLQSGVPAHQRQTCTETRPRLCSDARTRFKGRLVPG
jgi:hypothetical protein